MFMNNNQSAFDDFCFFNESKDNKLQRGLSTERFSHPFIENGFDNMYDLGQIKWNSCPSSFSLKKNQLFQNEESPEILDDNSSNLADTEEHMTLPVECDEKERKSCDQIKELDTDEHSLHSIKFNDRDVGELLDIISKPNTDMNALLSDVLTAGPTDPMVKRKRAVTKKVKGRRVRKSKEQIDVLTKEYEINSDWSSEEINALASRLNLTKKQVYKWYWDQKVSNGEAKPKNW